MKKTLYPILTCIALLTSSLFSHLAFAEAEMMVKVEIIIFENRQLSQIDMEKWPSHPALPELKDSINLLQTDSPQLRPYQVLNQDQLNLRKEAANIAHDPNYNLLLHVAWLQPLAQQQSLPVHLFAKDNFEGIYKMAEYDPSNDWKLDGIISLKKRQYYEVKTDLSLNKAKPLDPAKSFVEKTDSTEPQTVFNYRLQQKRRMRDNELHYIDNPVFGILIKVTPTPVLVDSSHVETASAVDSVQDNNV